MRTLKILFLSLWLVLFSCVGRGSISAQSTADQSEEVVLQAVASLQNYSFRSELTAHTELRDEDGKITNSYSAALLEGTVAANGNRQINLKQFAGEDLLSLFTKRALIVDLVKIDNERYIKVGNIEYLEIVRPGWWRYDDLVSQFGNTTTQYILDAALQFKVPSELPLSSDYMQSVTELEPETTNGIPMRVFDVELDAVGIMLAQMPGSSEEKQTAMEENQALIDAAELSISYRLWIGAADGLLYRGTATSHTYLPYLTAAGSESGTPPYDIKTDTSGSFKITAHDIEPIITAPALVNQLP